MLARRFAFASFALRSARCISAPLPIARRDVMSDGDSRERTDDDRAAGPRAIAPSGRATQARSCVIP